MRAGHNAATQTAAPGSTSLPGVPRGGRLQRLPKEPLPADTPAAAAAAAAQAPAVLPAMTECRTTFGEQAHPWAQSKAKSLP